MDELVKTLVEANQKLVEQVVVMARLIVESHSPRVAPQNILPDVPFSNEKLYVDEDEEDAMHAYKVGIASTEELSRVLLEQGFQNTDIELA